MKKYSILLLRGASAISFMAAAPAMAQMAPAAPVGAEAGGSAAPDDGSIADIVVTAQRREQRLQDVPITITAITGAQAAVAGVTGTATLQTAVPGLIINRQANNAAPYIRGIGTSNSNPSSENSVAIYVDGVYQPAPFGNFFEFNNIERIEVLKGPQGTLFGRNATGGVIQIITRDPKQEFEADLSASLARFDKVTASAYVSGGLSEDLAANVAVMYDRQAKGWGKSLTTGQELFKSQNFGVRSKLLFTPGDNTAVRLTGDYLRVRNCGICGQVVPGAASTTTLSRYPGRYNNRSETNQFARNKSYGGSLTIDHDAEIFKLRSITAYRKLRGHIVFDTDGSPETIANIEYDAQKAKTLSQEFHLISPTGSKIDWLAGLFLYSHTAGADPYISTGTAFGPSNSAALINFANTRTRSVAIFAQATYPISDETNLTVGARYTWDKIRYVGERFRVVPPAAPVLIQPQGTLRTKTDKPTWRISLDHKIDANVLAFVSYNRGFKTGNFSTTTGPVGNIPTQPEVLDAYEAGLKTDLFGRTVRLNGSFFYYEFTNIQLTRFLSGGSIPFNGGQAKLYGADIELQARITPHFTIDGNLGLVHSRMGDFPNAPNTIRLPNGTVVRGPDTYNAKGNDLPNAPKITANLSGTYTVPSSVGEFAFSGNVYYNDGRYAEVDNRLRDKSYVLVGASAGWTSVDGKYGLRIWGKNLTNSYYYAQLFSQVFTADLGSPAGPPRTYGVTVELHF